MALYQKFPHETIDALNIICAKYNEIFQDTDLLINTTLPNSIFSTWPLSHFNARPIHEYLRGLRNQCIFMIESIPAQLISIDEHHPRQLNSSIYTILGNLE